MVAQLTLCSWHCFPAISAQLQLHRPAPAQPAGPAQHLQDTIADKASLKESKKKDDKRQQLHACPAAALLHVQAAGSLLHTLAENATHAPSCKPYYKLKRTR